MPGLLNDVGRTHKHALKVIRENGTLHVEFCAQPFCGWNWLELLGILIFGWTVYYGSPIARKVAVCIAIVLFKLKAGTVLQESALAVPDYGLQLETHFGLPPSRFTRAIPVSTRRHFIPLCSIKDIIINEGLRGWNVRYYLAVVRRAAGIRDDGEDIEIDVVFPETLPHFPLLKEVYHGLRETLFDEFADNSATD